MSGCPLTTEGLKQDAEQRKAAIQATNDLAGQLQARNKSKFDLTMDELALHLAGREAA